MNVMISAVCSRAQVARKVRFRLMGSLARCCWLAIIIRGRIQADMMVSGVVILSSVIRVFVVCGLLLSG